jgi:glycosyltransferase involved in cell wall biosynthesis
MTSVSVVIPTRDRSELLATTLRSVLWQRGVDMEVIVVDDGSTDATPEVVSGADDARVALVRREEAGGPSAARNLGAARAGGEWLAFVDDDDVWAPTKLARQVAAADEAARGWSYVGAVTVDPDLSVVGGRPPPSPEEVVATLPRSNPIPGGGSNVVLRRGELDQVGGFDERLAQCEDWELWVRLARSGPPAAVSEPLMGYRVHTGGTSLDVDGIVRAARTIEELHATTLDWGRIHRWLAESYLRNDRHLRALGQFARAAVRGQAAGVASDLLDVVRRRAARISGEGSAMMTSDRGWAAGALPWLRELQRRPPAATGEASAR